MVSSRVETLATLIEAVARRRLEMLRRNLPSREHGTNRARGGKIASDGCEAAHGIVDAGAEVDNATSIGETPLYIAANNGHEAVLKALINAGYRPT